MRTICGTIVVAAIAMPCISDAIADDGGVDAGLCKKWPLQERIDAIAADGGGTLVLTAGRQRAGREGNPEGGRAVYRRRPFGGRAQALANWSGAATCAGAARFAARSGRRAMLAELAESEFDTKKICYDIVCQRQVRQDK